EVTADHIRMLLEADTVTHVMVGVIDLDGTLRAKHLDCDKVRRALDGDLRFCDVVLAFDSNDTVYENTTATGWHTGFPDQPVHLIVESCRPLPGERSSYLLLADYGEPLEAISPRSALRRVLAHAQALGFRVSAAFEYEFVLFQEAPNAVRDKAYRDLRPLAPGAFAYSALRSSVWREVYDDILAMCEEM